ncbi:MAG: NADH-quinone oxidoreductase subunit M [Bacteroidia bacterium]
MSKDLLYLLIFQLLSCIICIFLKNENAKKGALILSIISFLFSFHMFFEIKNDGGTYYLTDFVWVQQLGIHFKTGMDGISFLLVQLTNFLVPLIIFSSFNREIKNSRAFYALIFLMQFALNGVFTALDGFLFYIFWELALIPIYFICWLWGGKDSVRITLKFFIYTLSGSLLMLVGLIYLYLQTPGEHTFDINAFYNLQLDSHQQTFIFWTFFLAFAIKMPIFPLHTWQPDTYTDAPTQGTMLLSGIMLKMGIYGVIRWLIPVVPGAMHEWLTLAIILSVIGIVYASCIALVQKDFKRMIAYSSIAHVGLISAGVFTLTIEGLQGAMYQMISHGVNVVGLFFIADILFDRMKTRQLDELGGIANSQRTFSILFMIILLGSVALPLTNGFIGEFLLLTGVYKYGAWTALFAGSTVILGAVYMLRSYKAIMLGDKNVSPEIFTPLANSEKTVLIIIAVVVIGTGVYAKPLLDIAEPSVKNILSHIH